MLTSDHCSTCLIIEKGPTMDASYRTQGDPTPHPPRSTPHRLQPGVARAITARGPGWGWPGPVVMPGDRAEERAVAELSRLVVGIDLEPAYVERIREAYPDLEVVVCTEPAELPV